MDRKAIRIVCDLRKDRDTFGRPNGGEPIAVVQGEADTLKLEVSITDHGSPFNLTGCSVELCAARPNGTSVIDAATITKALYGRVDYLVPGVLGAVVGRVRAHFKIKCNGVEIACAQPFFFDVARGVDISDAGATDYLPKYDEHMRAMEQATANANAAAQSANTAAASANSAIDKAVTEIVPDEVANAVASEMAKYSAVSFSVNPDDGGLDITYSY